MQCRKHLTVIKSLIADFRFSTPYAYYITGTVNLSHLFIQADYPYMLISLCR